MMQGRGALGKKEKEHSMCLKISVFAARLGQKFTCAIACDVRFAVVKTKAASLRRDDKRACIVSSRLNEVCALLFVVASAGYENLSVDASGIDKPTIFCGS
mmetsp:Transcript_943/g.2621  ORF Transcript_943/g.2621 Transcript_943/m.2621 type:complete len:101 (-) Transcript_943:218-520(-)